MCTPAAGGRSGRSALPAAAAAQIPHEDRELAKRITYAIIYGKWLVIRDRSWQVCVPGWCCVSTQCCWVGEGGQGWCIKAVDGLSKEQSNLSNIEAVSLHAAHVISCWHQVAQLMGWLRAWSNLGSRSQCRLYSSTWTHS